MFKLILVPTDGSLLSQEATQKAIEFAKDTHAKIIFFYARPEYPVALYGEGALIDPTTPDRFAEIAEIQGNEILLACQKEAERHNVGSETRTASGNTPWEAIIEAAKADQCDLIFMASHGRKGLSGLLLGSETQKVLTHSKIPVLVYR